MKSSVWFGKIAGYKSQLFSNLKGKARKVLEIGIGTGPNLKYYAGDADVQVFGVDPNGKMEKYARAAAVAAGLPLAKFEFIQAVRMLPWRYFFLKTFCDGGILCLEIVLPMISYLEMILQPGYIFALKLSMRDKHPNYWKTF